MDSTADPVTSETLDSTYLHGHSYVFVFKSDSTFTETNYETTPASSVAVGTYSLNHATGNLTLVSPTVNETDQYNITGNTLTISAFFYYTGIESVAAHIVLTKQ